MHLRSRNLKQPVPVVAFQPASSLALARPFPASPAAPSSCPLRRSSTPLAPRLPPSHLSPPSPVVASAGAAPPLDSTSLLAANDAFYAALSTRSVGVMMGLWLPASDAISVSHPLNGLVVGADEVASAWAGMFALGAVVSCEVDVVRMEVSPNTGWVVCTQKIVSERGKETVGGERVATNIFHAYRGQWKLAHHSAAPYVF